MKLRTQPANRFLDAFRTRSRPWCDWPRFDFPAHTTAAATVRGWWWGWFYTVLWRTKSTKFNIKIKLISKQVLEINYKSTHKQSLKRYYFDFLWTLFIKNKSFGGMCSETTKHSKRVVWEAFQKNEKIKKILAYSFGTIFSPLPTIFSFSS